MQVGDPPGTPRWCFQAWVAEAASLALPWPVSSAFGVELKPLVPSTREAGQLTRARGESDVLRHASRRVDGRVRMNEACWVEEEEEAGCYTKLFIYCCMCWRHGLSHGRCTESPRTGLCLWAPTAVLPPCSSPHSGVTIGWGISQGLKYLPRAVGVWGMFKTTGSWVGKRSAVPLGISDVSYNFWWEGCRAGCAAEYSLTRMEQNILKWCMESQSFSPPF